jgi:hypothetical protein
MNPNAKFNYMEENNESKFILVCKFKNDPKEYFILEGDDSLSITEQSNKATGFNDYDDAYRFYYSFNEYFDRFKTVYAYDVYQKEDFEFMIKGNS